MTLDTVERDHFTIAICDLLEILGTPAVLLDKEGFAVAANALARGSLGSELQIVNARLASSEACVSAAINKLVKCLVSNERRSPRALSIRRPGDFPIVVYGFQLTQAALASLDPVRAILVLIDPRSRPLPTEAQLKDAFDLSWMETKLMLCLAGGVSLEAAAATCGVTYESARSLLKSAFHKTGTHRQAALVALVYSLALLPRPLSSLACSAPSCEFGTQSAGPVTL